MKNFSFIVSPATIGQLKSVYPSIKILPNFIVRSAFEHRQPFKIAHFKAIKSTQGKAIDGFLIACPLFFGEHQELKDEAILDKIIAAGQLAESLGSGIVGLNGSASLIADKYDYVVKKNLKIPMTTGNPLTTWSVFEAIYRFAKINAIDLKKMTLAVVGASHAPGSLCARKLSEHVGKLIISGRFLERLEGLKEEIHRTHPVEVIIEEDPHVAVKDADIVVNGGKSPWTPFNIVDLKFGSTVFDISLSPVLKRGATRRLAGACQHSLAIAFCQFSQ